LLETWRLAKVLAVVEIATLKSKVSDDGNNEIFFNLHGVRFFWVASFLCGSSSDLRDCCAIRAFAGSGTTTCAARAACTRG
jgi:hypothetical protein